MVKASKMNPADLIYRFRLQRESPIAWFLLTKMYEFGVTFKEIMLESWTSWMPPVFLFCPMSTRSRPLWT